MLTFKGMRAGLSASPSGPVVCTVRDLRLFFHILESAHHDFVLQLSLSRFDALVYSLETTAHDEACRLTAHLEI